MVFKHFCSSFFSRRGLLMLAYAVAMIAAPVARAQSLGNAGTIEGSVTDPTGSSIPGAKVTIRNPVSGYSQSATTATDGTFRLTNIPPNPYHLEVAAAGFDDFSQDVTVRNAIPVPVKVSLAVAGGRTNVNVEATGADVLENNPSAHIDVDRSLILKLP